MPAYACPKTLDEALDHLASGAWTVVAGGTDFYPARTGRAIGEQMLDITGINPLRGITKDGGYWRLGGLTPWSAIEGAGLPAAFDGLKCAAGQIGSVQIQNTATIAGNLCNASPAADGVPPLLTLEAEVELSSRGGTRTLPVAEFITGNRKTAIEPGELLTAVLIPVESATGIGCFLKLGVREYMVISMVSVAAWIQSAADGRIENARIAVGACSEIPRRLPGLEQSLAGLTVDDALDPALAGGIEAACLADLSPIGDVRATAAYRLHAAAELIGRAIRQCAKNGSWGRP